MSNDGFGNSFESVREGDIDFLLLEEFHCTSEFTDWFCRAMGFEDVEFDGAWRSVSDVDGETDLILRVRHQGSRLGLFIENKIDAPEQDAQDTRYHKRARRAREQGKIDEYKTAMIAPQCYLDSLPESSEYEKRLSYEDIEQWFRSHGDRRSLWRGNAMREAIERNRRASNMVVNSTRTQFFDDYWQYLRRKHFEFIMKPQTKKGSSSTWVYFKGRKFPASDVGFIHKVEKCIIELNFTGKTIEEIQERIRQTSAEVPESANHAQFGKSAGLQITVPQINFEVPFKEQVEVIERVLDKAYLLVPLGTLFSDIKRSAV